MHVLGVKQGITKLRGVNSVIFPRFCFGFTKACPQFTKRLIRTTNTPKHETQGTRLSLTGEGTQETQYGVRLVEAKNQGSTGI